MIKLSEMCFCLSAWEVQKMSPTWKTKKKRNESAIWGSHRPRDPVRGIQGCLIFEVSWTYLIISKSHDSEISSLWYVCILHIDTLIVHPRTHNVQSIKRSSFSVNGWLGVFWNIQNDLASRLAAKMMKINELCNPCVWAGRGGCKVNSLNIPSLHVVTWFQIPNRCLLFLFGEGSISADKNWK